MGAGLGGRTLGGFRILELIQDEESAQGTVCKAVCEAERRDLGVTKGQIVALKVMPVRDDDLRQQWIKLEARTRELSRLNHPNVVRYYGCFCEQGEWNELHVIVQEFLEGETLKERLKRFPKGLDVDEGLKIVESALEGLSHTASKGIVHRDIKPGNIFLCERTRNGRKELTVKLIDFEVAKQGHGSTTASTGNLRGSFNYMAPEFLDARFRGDTVSDVFSLGVTLHEALTGKLPYDQIDGNGEVAILRFVSRWKGFGLSSGMAEPENPDDEQPDTCATLPTVGVGGVSSNPIVIGKHVNRLLAHADQLFDGCLSPLRERRFKSFEDFRAAIRLVRFRTLTSPSSGSAYRLLQLVGKGGFGEVFKARETKTGRVVAIKHLRRAKYADRFKREAKILSKFDDGCCVRFVESFSKEQDGKQQEFLVMEFLEGMPGYSLLDAIRKSNGNGLPVQDVFTAFIRYAHGLKLLHSEGVFHRDIKPSNLYFPAGRPDRAAIMDLGIARDTQGTMTVGSVPGTPDYMPPEVVTAGSRGESGMDVYALGLCLYEALTAKTAFARLPSDIDGLKKLVERVNSKAQPRFDDTRVDADVFDLLTDMTAFNPAYRIKDVGEVERRLREFLAKLGSPAAALPVSEPRVKAREGAPDRIMAWGGTIAAAGLLALFAVKVVGPWAKRSYAERQLTKVLNAYGRMAPEADDLERAWVAEFNPGAAGWHRLDAGAFAKCTNAVDGARRRARAEKSRRDWMARIADCVSPDGKLNVAAYGKLNAGDLPAELEGEDQVRDKMSDLGRAVKDELVRCVAIGEVKTRRARLKTADDLLANHWTVRVLPSDEIQRLKKIRDRAASLCVGSIRNGSSGAIEVCGVKIAVGETRIVQIVDGKPEHQFMTRQGYRPVPLPANFDGAELGIDDSSFVINAIRLSIPRLADGQSFVLLDREYAGGEEVELNPGHYVGRYVRADYRPQTNVFEVSSGRGGTLRAPQDWIPTEGLERLQKAGKLGERKAWKEVDGKLDGIRVTSAENVKELERLRRGVAEWKRGEAEKIEKAKAEAERKLSEQRKKLRADLDALLSQEPVKGRRERLKRAAELLKSEKVKGVLDGEEIERRSDDVRDAAHWIVGWVRNDGVFPIEAAGMLISTNESRLVRYDNRVQKAVLVTAKGYEDRRISGELDEREVVLTKGQWVPADVPVRIVGTRKDVKCSFNGEPVSGEFKVSPGRYSLVFRRTDYEPQAVDFVARMIDGCTVEVPHDWKPLPVEVSLRELETGVKCHLGASEISKSVRLTPGKAYVFRYTKPDCVDQKVSIVVEAGVSAVVPAPSAWTDSDDAKKLSRAEQLVSEWKCDEAARLVENVVLNSPDNLERLRTLKNKIGKSTVLKESVDLAQMSYEDGDFSECIRYYHVARENGYTFSAEDRKLVEQAYEKASDELAKMLKNALHDIEIRRTPIRDPEAIKKDMRQLKTRYVTIRK